MAARHNLGSALHTAKRFGEALHVLEALRTVFDKIIIIINNNNNNSNSVVVVVVAVGPPRPPGRRRGPPHGRA